MFTDRSRRATDLPEPPSPDVVAAGFAVPLVTLATQGAVEEAGVSLSSQTQNGHPVMESASLSYTLWRNPTDHGDPANLAELTEEISSALDAEPLWPLPDWLLKRRALVRYPALWDAVRTTHVSDGFTWYTPESVLVEHVNNIVMNFFRDDHAGGGFPGEFVNAVSEKAIEHGVPISVDGVDVPGLRVDTDPHVFAVGADLGDRIFTGVVAREHLPFLNWKFISRPKSSEA